MLSNAPASTFSWYSAENFEARSTDNGIKVRLQKIGENQLDKLTAFNLAMRNLICWGS
ncbi:hypothetical protein O9992_17790 [Vibrio lentus]|nr:hypothetical protein [Vibrio lentus]